MGIQINGQTDTISASDGGLVVSGQELTGVTDINASGIGTFNNGIRVTGAGSSIGIGTNNPAEQLELSAGSERLMIGANSPSSYSRIAARNTANTGYRGFQIDGSDLLINSNTSGNVIIGTGGGNTGIGTNSPLAKLDVRGNMVLGYGVTTSITLLEKQFATAHSSSNRGGILRVGLTDGSFSGVEIDNGVGSNSSFNSQNVHLITHNGGVAGDIRALTARFDGNVGVGTTRPFVAFEVQNSTYPHIVSNYNNSKHIRMSVGGSGGGFAITDGHFLSIAHQPFADRATDSNLTERMRINSGGSSGFFNAGDTIWGASSTGAGTAQAIYVGSHSATGIFGGSVCYKVFTNGNVVNTNNSYGSLSDIKLKENIVDANSQWDDLKAIKVRNYNFKEGQTHTQIGVVAQEVEIVSPGLVTESPDRDAEGNDLGTVTKSVNYSVLYMKAVKALQEAMERIETLESKVAALEAQ